MHALLLFLLLLSLLMLVSLLLLVDIISSMCLGILCQQMFASSGGTICSWLLISDAAGQALHSSGEVGLKEKGQ